ncbi:WD domain, G-beta repeat protein (macronuclear) [Tetrahymena thermophila SB210]|uniref:WD domain, G-beta repeat protein n=1 Tax=Tetrahymena thermophila (strain SB210) TaxID=312017 RepID=Q23FE3_TETTS|nr:WD domain, G-beta repeat protein [Tetrahymena thermophila SB210]EAR95210.2 WD domain, G-beta repeat protein [Tetrahymena thermophila SB210]|eukprot:XP_001015455.2 WD domain, G-beta repeat protein [Tetrahymena thermophila SB210]
MYRFGENIHQEFQKKYDKYIDDKKIQKDIQLSAQVFEMHQMFTKCLYNFKPLIAQNSEGYRIMIFHILQVYQQYMLTGLVNTDQFIQKDIKEHIKEIEYFIQYLKLKVKTQPCLDLVFLSEFYLDINRNRVGLDTASLTGYEKLADFMIDAVVFSLKAVVAIHTGAVVELIPDIVEFVLKVCKELNDIREYQSNQFVKVDGIQIKNMKFLFLFNLYKTKIDKFKGEFLRLPAEKEIEFFIEQYLIFKEKKLSDQYMLYILAQINFLFDVVLFEKSSKSDFEGIKNVADLMHNFVDILLQRSNNKDKQKEQQSYYSFAVKNTTFRFLANSILIKYRIILGKIPFKQEEQQQITIHLIHSLLSEKDDRVKILFKKDQKLIDIAKQVIIDDQLSQDVINYAIQRIHSMQEYHLESVQEKIRNKSDIEKQIIRCLYEKWEDEVHRRQESNIEQKDDVLLEVIQFYVNQKITVIKGQLSQKEDQKLTNAIDDIFEFFLKSDSLQSSTDETVCQVKKTCRILGILAEGGAGKSMLLRQIEARLKEEDEDGLSILPIFIKCNSLDAQNPSIESYLESFDFPIEQIEKLKQSDWNKLILLDGFDEYSGNYFNVYSQLKISEWQNTLVIVSSRQEKLSVDDASLCFSIKDDNFNVIESSYVLVKLLEFQKKDIEIYYQQFFRKLSIQQEYDEVQQKKLELEKIKVMEECLQNKQIEKLLYLPINLYLFTRLIAEIQDNSKRDIIEQITDQISVQEYFFSQQFRREAISFIDDYKIQSKIYNREELITMIVSNYFTYFQTIAIHMFSNLQKKNFLQVRLFQIKNIFSLSENVQSILNDEQKEDLKQKILLYENSNIITRFQSLESIRNNGVNDSNVQDYVNLLSQEDENDKLFYLDLIEFKHKSIYEYFAARAMKTDFDIHKESIFKLSLSELEKFNINKKTIINPGKNQTEYQILKKFYKLIQKDIDSQFFRETYYLDSLQHNNRYIQYLKRSIIKNSNDISLIDIGASNLISVLFLSNFQFPRLNLSRCSFSRAYIPQQKDESINLDYCNLSEAYLKGSNLNFIYANTKNANFHSFQLKYNSKNTFSYKSVVIGEGNSIYALSLTGYLNEFRISKGDFSIVRSQSISQEPLYDLCMCSGNLILHSDNNLIQVNKRTFRNENQKKFSEGIKYICVSTYNQILVLTGTSSCYYGSFEFGFNFIKNVKGNKAMFSSTGNYLLLANTENKLEIRKVSDNFNNVTSLFFKAEQKIVAAFSSDDTYLLVAQQNKLKVLKQSQNQFVLSEQFEIDNQSASDIVSLAFSNNDQYLVISSSNSSQIREFIQPINSTKSQSLTVSQINTSKALEKNEFIIKVMNFIAINQTLQFTNDSQYLLAYNQFQLSLFDSSFELLNQKQQNPLNEIKAFAISPDEQNIALYSLDDSCKFFNTSQNYQLQDQFNNNTLISTQIAFSSDGLYFAVCFADKTCYIRNAKNFFKHKCEIPIELNNKCILDFYKKKNREYLIIVSDLRYYILDVQNDFQILINHPLINSAAAIAKNGLLLAYCLEDSLTVFDLFDKSKIIIKENNYTDTNKLIAFSGDSKYFAQSFEKTKCQIWLLEKQQKKTLTCHDQQISSIAFSGDGQYFATSSIDFTCKLWSVSTDFDLLETIDCSNSCVTYLTFYPHRNILVACDQDFSFQLWDIEKMYISINKNKINQGDYVSSQFSPDNKYLAIGTSEGYCKIWNTKNYKSLFKIKVYSKSINQVIFSSNGKYIITSSEDKTCRVIEIQNNNFKLTNYVIYHFGPIIQICISQDCKYLVTSSTDKKCNIWNTQEGFKLQSTLKDNNNKIISIVSISADSSHLACCTEKDNVLNIYNLSDLKLIYKKQFKFTIVSIIYSSDGNYLIICTLHGNEILSKFNYQTLFIQENDLNLYKSLTVSQDSNYIAAVHEFDDQNECSLIKIDQGFKDIQKIQHISEYLNKVSISIDADYLAVMSDKDQFKILNKYSRIQNVKQIKCNRRAIYSICFSKDGRYLVTSTSEDLCEVWDSQDQYRKIKEARISHNRQNFSQRNSSSEEVDLLLSSLQKNQIILDLNAESQLNKQFEKGEQFDSNSHIFAAAFSFDDMYLATASSDKTCKVWQVENSFYLHKTLTGHSSSVSSVSFSPDGQYLITGSKDSSFKIWSLLNDFQLLQTIQNSFNQNFPISSVAFSSYGKYFATGSYDNSCKIWNAQNEFKLLQQLDGHTSHVYCIAFSDNDQFFASGSSDSTCKIWRIGDKFKLVKSIEFHKSGVYALNFSKQSKYLATGSYDGTCGIWNASSQFQLISLINNIQSGIYSLAFSNDGEQLIIGNQISSMQTTLKTQNKLQIIQIQQDYNSIYLL